MKTYTDERGEKFALLTIAQHEALMAAAKRLYKRRHILKAYSDARNGEQLDKEIAALRAAGIDLEEKTK